MLQVRKANERGSANHGWLYTQHTFSFANYYDPKEIGFSDLLVINDDRVQPGKGFGTHPHRDMEIFSYVLDGALEHKDSMGNGSIIHPGDVQMMSAGTGVLHSEFNPQSDKPTHFLQIWIMPNRVGVLPRYRQKHFKEEEKRGKLRLIISPEEENDSLSVYQDIRVYAGLFDTNEHATLTLPENRYVYVHLARGSLLLNGQPLNAGDGVRIRNERALTFSGGNGAEVLVFDMRPNELPEF
ncbi:MAG: pirin family protein [Burkholderiales bacterium]|jgi:redox-sensitive bicupin YhaK (pirin superfamily)|nr:pirin family protein [Burkholderiales bacterium]